MNDVVINKTQSIQRCIKRAREELKKEGRDFTIDLANHIIKSNKLGIPTDSRQSFDLLSAADVITGKLAGKLKKMIGFRNTAIHEYQQIDLGIVVHIIEEDSEDLLRFTEDALKWDKNEEKQSEFVM